MTPQLGRARALLPLVIAAALLVALVIALPLFLTPYVAGRLRAQASERGLEARWKELAVRLPMHLSVRGLEIDRREPRTPFVRADRIDASLGFRDWRLRPHVTKLEIENMQVRLPGASDEESEPEPVEEKPGQGPAAPKVRAAAAQLADALMLPARRMPEIRLLALDLSRGDSLFAHIEALELSHSKSGVQFATHGLLAGEERVPFEAAIQWQQDDRLEGRASFEIPDEQLGASRLRGVVDGRVTQDRRDGVLRVQPGSRLVVGRTEAEFEGEVRTEGPRFRLALNAKGLTASDIQESFPRAVLGPLADLTVKGSWDWNASLDVDVARPDSTRFTADVVPHNLVLAGGGARLPIFQLAGPFVAHIHVPKDRIVYRELTFENPNYRPLPNISPLLREAVITNEDGGFYRHRGFNTEAIQMAMAANLRAGRFERGAGTITMQLARNLFLGHRRTLSRKGQEVVLAWVLEHLTGLSKDRLLEIYLNIIEWGPGVHGANEAARYYFDRDASELTLDEALFLTIIVPSPNRWKTRVDAHGELRPWARAQMAFIARKMAARGMIPPEQVPPAEFLSVHLRGAAGAQFTPVDTMTAGAPEPSFAP